jgi:hypothetical protein
MYAKPKKAAQIKVGQKVRITATVRKGSIGTYAGNESTLIGIRYRIEFEDGTGAGLYGVSDFVEVR